MTPEAALTFISAASSWEEFCSRTLSIGPRVDKVPLGPPLSELSPQLIDTRYVMVHQSSSHAESYNPNFYYSGDRRQWEAEFPPPSLP